MNNSYQQRVPPTLKLTTYGGSANHSSKGIQAFIINTGTGQHASLRFSTPIYHGRPIMAILAFFIAVFLSRSRKRPLPQTFSKNIIAQ